MPKARPHPDQLGFAFTSPKVAKAPGALAGFERRISLTAATILASAGRPREVIAAEMSVLLDEEISRTMLDAYASPARDQHKVIMSRFLALVAVTNRHDLLDPLLREIGAALLVGNEVKTARLGHLRRQVKEIQAELRALEQDAPLIGGDRNGKPRNDM